MLAMPVICLMGPTASGKTSVAMELVDRFPFEIISVDSALVYRGMDVGTAKPRPNELREYPHHLVDIRDPEETYSAGDFVRDAKRLIGEIQAAGRMPLLVGGTMMYFRALTQGMADLPPANLVVRNKIDQEAAALGWTAMHQKLAQIDPQSAARINANDQQRLQRALEVYELSGRPLSSWQQDTPEVGGDFKKFALSPEPRVVLHERIEKRLEQMLNQGFINEVKNLMKRPDLTRDHASMRAVGYRQIWSHLRDEIDLNMARDKVLAATRQLAKRQLTWLRGDQAVEIIDPLEINATDTISRFVKSGM